MIQIDPTHFMTPTQISMIPVAPFFRSPPKSSALPSASVLLLPLPLLPYFFSRRPPPSPPRPSPLPLPATAPQRCHQPHRHWSPRHPCLSLAPPRLLLRRPDLPLSLSQPPPLMPPPDTSSSVTTASTSTPGPTWTPLLLPQPSPLPLPAATPQWHRRPHGVEINEAMVGAAPDAGGPNGIGGGGAAGDEGAANGEGAAGGIIGSGIDGGEEEAGGAIEEHDGVAARDVEGEGVVEDDALGVEADSDARGGVGEGDEVDDTGWRGGWR